MKGGEVEWRFVSVVVRVCVVVGVVVGVCAVFGLDIVGEFDEVF